MTKDTYRVQCRRDSKEWMAVSADFSSLEAAINHAENQQYYYETDLKAGKTEPGWQQRIVKLHYEVMEWGQS